MMQLNYDVLPTLNLQFENLTRLKKNDDPLNFDLMRTETELKEILDFIRSEKDYFKSKCGRVKRAYISEIDSSLQPYDVMVPNYYDADRKYALFLYLHGYENEIQKYKTIAKLDLVSPRTPVLSKQLKTIEPLQS